MAEIIPFKNQQEEKKKGVKNWDLGRLDIQLKRKVFLANRIAAIEESQKLSPEEKSELKATVERDANEDFVKNELRERWLFTEADFAALEEYEDSHTDRTFTPEEQGKLAEMKELVRQVREALRNEDIEMTTLKHKEDLAA